MILVYGLIFLIFLAGSCIGGYLCFWIADALFHTYWLNWLSAALAWIAIMSSFVYLIWGKAPVQDARPPSGTSLCSLIIGFLIGSWWNRE